MTPLAAASDAGQLHARIENIAGLQLDLVTVGCAGACADVVAAARGGNPPYTFEWDDGSTTTARRVCPHTDAQLTLAVTDTGFENTEFGYDAQTATTAVTAKVLACPDAGTREPEADSGTSPPQERQEPSCGPKVSTSAAADCRILRQTEGCSTDSWRRTYTLPFPLLEDSPGCLVAFGNLQDKASEPTLTFDVLASWTLLGCGNGGSLRKIPGYLPPNDEGHGRVICLGAPPITPPDAVTIDVVPDTIDGFGDLELRWCDVCPSSS